MSRLLVMLGAAAALLVVPANLSAEEKPADSAKSATVTVRAKSKPAQEWKEYPTRTLERLEGFTPPAKAPALSKYGGRLDRKADATGFFHACKVGDRWWLADPEGCLFIHVGVASVSPGRSANNRAALKSKFGDENNWAAATTRLLWDSGFNGAGAWSATGPLRASPQPVAYTLIWNFMSNFAKKKGLATQLPGHTGYPNDCIFVFDPEFPAFCDEQARALEATRDDPWLVGHFSDNELPAPKDMLDRFLALDATNPNFAPGRREAQGWLSKRKGREAAKADIADADRDEFMGHVFGRYLEITTQAIRRHDPKHMCLGSRFHSNEKRGQAVFREAGRFLDAISVNYYGVWGPQPATLADWTRWSGKPVMITEWYVKGADTPLKNTTGAGWIVPTQRDRGLFYQHYVLGLLESGTVVGWHWFKYMDNDPEDLSTDPSNRDSNKGIVTIKYEPYAPLLDLMRELNRNVYSLADWFDSRRTGR